MKNKKRVIKLIWVVDLHLDDGTNFYGEYSTEEEALYAANKVINNLGFTEKDKQDGIQ